MLASALVLEALPAATTTTNLTELAHALGHISFSLCPPRFPQAKTSVKSRTPEGIRRPMVCQPTKANRLQ